MDDLYYEARLDGEWVRLIYDKKNDLLRFVDMELVNETSKVFELTVIDNVGNVKTRTYAVNQ